MVYFRFLSRSSSTPQVSQGFTGIIQDPHCRFLQDEGHLQDQDIGFTSGFFQDLHLHLRFLKVSQASSRILTAGSCRMRDIYRTRTYGLLQVSTGFHRQIQVQDLQCSFKNFIYTSGFSRFHRNHLKVRIYTTERK